MNESVFGLQRKIYLWGCGIWENTNRIKCKLSLSVDRRVEGNAGRGGGSCRCAGRPGAPSRAPIGNPRQHEYVHPRKCRRTVNGNVSSARLGIFHIVVDNTKEFLALQNNPLTRAVPRAFFPFRGASLGARLSLVVTELGTELPSPRPGDREASHRF